MIGSIHSNNDEIIHYEDLRTVGETEAFWRLYEF